MTEMEEKVKIQDWVDEKFKDKLTGRNIQQLYLKSDLVDSIYEYSQVRFNEFSEQIEKMKMCFNCKYQNKFVENKCGECEDYSEWEIKENV